MTLKLNVPLLLTVVEYCAKSRSAGMRVHTYKHYSAAQPYHCSCYKADNAGLKQCCILVNQPIVSYIPSKRCTCQCNMQIWVRSKSDLDRYAQKHAGRNARSSLPTIRRCTSADNSTVQNHLLCHVH